MDCDQQVEERISELIKQIVDAGGTRKSIEERFLKHKDNKTVQSIIDAIELEIRMRKLEELENERSS
jgi:hypothetical protein